MYACTPARTHARTLVGRTTAVGPVMSCHARRRAWNAVVLLLVSLSLSLSLSRSLAGLASRPSGRPLVRHLLLHGRATYYLYHLLLLIMLMLLLLLLSCRQPHHLPHAGIKLDVFWSLAAHSTYTPAPPRMWHGRSNSRRGPRHQFPPPLLSSVHPQTSPPPSGPSTASNDGAAPPAAQPSPGMSRGPAAGAQQQVQVQAQVQVDAGRS